MIRVIAMKELSALFAAPLAWIVLAALQLVLAYLFLMRLDGFLELQPRLAQLAHAPGATEMVIAPFFSGTAVVLMMATPLLSMRLIADERRNQTMTLLLSSPISMTQIVLGKFAGLVAFLLLVVGMATVMALSLSLGASLDPGLLASNVAGLALLVTTFAAVGLWMSSLTPNPVVAAVGTLAMLLASWLLAQANADPGSVTALLSVTRRFEAFNRGIVGSADLIWHLVVIGLLIALTVRRLDRDRLLG